MLADGFWPGAATLVAGPTGSGKTVMGLHFIFAGARRGEPGVIATLQENPTQLQRMVHGLGWPADDPAIEVMYRSPVDIYIDEWVYDLLRTVERTGARRILLDSLMDLRTAGADEARFREFMYSLAQRFSRQGVSLFMTYEAPELFGARTLSEFAVPHLSDNVIALNYYKDHGSLKRAMSVIKTQASRHESATRQYDIGRRGITISDIAQPEEQPEEQTE
jgi:circadian clock protein KaiC